MDFDQNLFTQCTTAIPGDIPAGESARYEPQFEAMQAEIDKLSALTGEQPDWALISDHASTLLASKSKDLLIAGYLAAALNETRGWAGLADGLNIITNLTATFWEGLQPTRLRARKAAIDWLLDRGQAQVEIVAVQDADRPAMLACVRLLDELVAFGENRWEGDAPTLWSWSKAIGKRIPEEIVAAVEAPVIEEAVSSSTEAASSAPSASRPSLASGALASRDDAYRAITAAAELLKVIEPHSPVSYLLRRACMWGNMPLPQLYAELQRAGTVWDLVLQELPESAGSTSLASSVASRPAAAPVVVAQPPPEPEPAARPLRGDF